MIWQIMLRSILQRQPSPSYYQNIQLRAPAAGLPGLPGSAVSVPRNGMRSQGAAGLPSQMGFAAAIIDHLPWDPTT